MDVDIFDGEQDRDVDFVASCKECRESFVRTLLWPIIETWVPRATEPHDVGLEVHLI